MTNGLFSLFSSLIANTPPYRKGLSSRKFLSLFLILFLAVGNAWGQVTLGTYNVGSFSNPGAGTKFQKYSEEVELYMWRASSGHSFSAGTGAGKGIKTQDSQSGLIFYLNQKSNIAPIINFNASKNAADVTVTLYTISNEDYNKFQEGAVNDTKVTFSKTEYTTKTIVIENVKGNYSETIEDIPAGYYFIVCTGTASNTYFNQIQFLAPSTPATKYSVTYDLNGGTGAAPTQPSVAENGTFTVASAEGITPPAGKEFAGWKCSVDDATYAAGATYTMGAAAVIFSAQWQAETTKYDVTYNLNGSPATEPTQPSVAEGTTITLAEAPTWEGYRFDGWLVKDENDNDVTVADGKFTMPAAKVAITAQWVKVWTVTFDTNGGSTIASVVVDDNGTLTAPTAPTKDCYAFGEWQKDGVAFDFTTAITSDITLTATWTPIYSSSATLISNDVKDGKPNVNTVFAASNIVSSITFAAGQYEFTSNTSKPGYYGYKVNTANDKITLLIEQGKRVKVLFGSLKNVPTIKVNNVSKSLDADRTEGNTAENTFTYTASGEDALVSITFGSGTSTLKKIDIYSLYNATYTDGTGDASGSDENVTEVTLPTPTAVSGWTFTGWIANQDVKYGDETKTAETILLAGTYTLLANTTFTAQWAATYTVIYDLNGVDGTVPTQAALVAGEKFTVADVDGITIPDGKAFAGWSDGANTYAAGSEYTMPASNVTLTAQWTDNNNVARIGDTYYTNLDDAVAYANANADAEIILLKDIDRADRITLTKDATINLNGNKLSKTDGGWLIFVKEGATLTINGETENSAIHGGISLGAMTNNNGSLVINGGTYTCADGVACVHVNGTCLESNVTIIGASLTSPTDIAVQLNGKGTYTITNATITGATGVYIKSGELTVTNSTIKGTKTPADYAYTGNGANATGDAIVVDACDYPGGAPTLNIISGTFDGTKGAVGNYNYNGTSAPAIGGIQGGTFNTEVPAVLCADGYIPVKNGENNYGVTKTAKTFSLEDLVTTQGTGDVYKEYLNNLGWSVANANALDKLNTEKPYDNYPYLGLKFKSAAGYVEGVVEGDKLLIIQLGHMAADADLYENGTKKVSLSGKDAETAAVHYYYVENQSTIKLQMTNDGTCVLKAITITDPFTVSFDAQGGSAVAALLEGKPSITLPTTTKEPETLLGWFDAATGGNKIGDAGEEYTPTKDIKLYAQWEAISTDTRIKALTYKIGTGEEINIHEDGKNTFDIVLPYANSYETITVAATPRHDAATIEGTITQPTSVPGTATFTVVAQDGSTKQTYTINFAKGPKDAACIFKAELTSATAAEYSGIYADATNSKINLSNDGDNGYKFSGKSNYIQMALTGGTFAEGDILHMTYKTAPQQGELAIYNNTTKIVGTSYLNSTLEFPVGAAGLSTLYIRRTDDNKFNGWVSVVEVTRIMNPMLTAITFDGVPGVIDEAKKKVTVELPFLSDVASMAVEPTIAWNAPAASGDKVVTSNSGNWVIGDNTYRLTDKDGDYTDYIITLTQAAASADATLATLTYNGTNITLVPDQYTYDIELPKGTTVVPTVTYTTNHTGATADMTDAADLPGATTIIVTAEDGTTKQNYTINFTVSRAISYVIYDGSVQESIESRTGNDATGFSWSMGSNVTINGSKVPSSWNGKNYTYVIKGFKPNKSTNNITSIVIPTGYLAKITLVGTTNSEGEERSLFIATSASSNKEDAMGDYIITSSDFNVQGFTTDYLQAGTYYLGSTEACRLYELSVVLYRIDYERPVRQGYYGTICLPNKGQMIGAAVYEIAYMDYKDGAPYKIYFDEILNGKMEAGVPYVFLPNEGYNQLIVTYTAIIDAPAAEVKGLCGFIGASATDEYQIPSGVGNYIIQNNQYREVLAGADARIVSNRAYIKLSEVPGYNDPLYVAPAPAPGRKRIAMGTTGAQVATGVDQVQGDEVPTKMIINGQLFILRGEKMYDAQGKLVK